MRTIVMVHGRAQEHKDPAGLKREWVDALHEGLRAAGIEDRVPDERIRFPYYGQTLFDLVHGAGTVAGVLVRGGAPDDPAEEEFVREVVRETAAAVGVTDEQIREAAGAEVALRGPQNWSWVQAALEVLDRHVPGASAATIALVTRDVYQYLRNPGIRDAIEAGVRAALVPGEEAIVVAHSLGTVVAYNLIRREAQAQGWRVPLLVTLGSPLAVSAVVRALRPLSYPAAVGGWLNAYDHADVVALFPLDDKHFPVVPGVENWGGVKNRTENRHGISGYLDDPAVARRIHAAATA